MKLTGKKRENMEPVIVGVSKDENRVPPKMAEAEPYK